MKYDVIRRGPRLEAMSAHSGYRIRLCTLAAGDLDHWPVTVHVRGSESEDEIRVDVPKKHLSSADEALDHGMRCAVMWIDAEDHRLR